jgi:hypothetical protein
MDKLRDGSAPGGGPLLPRPRRAMPSRFRCYDNKSRDKAAWPINWTQIDR